MPAPAVALIRRSIHTSAFHIRAEGPIRLLSIQTGVPKTVGVPGSDDPMERLFTSAIWKQPVTGPIWAGALGLAGDAVANRRHHGGRNQAVLAYASSHYPLWRAEWGRSDVGPGNFGENLTIEGATEETTCIGDVVELGDAQFEVSHPRVPCATLARRHQVRDLVRIVYANGRTGWHLRVVREGWIEAGMPVQLVRRPYPAWTVRRVSLVMLHRAERAAEAAQLAACPALSEEWRERLGGERVKS